MNKGAFPHEEFIYPLHPLQEDDVISGNWSILVVLKGDSAFFQAQEIQVLKVPQLVWTTVAFGITFS